MEKDQNTITTKQTARKWSAVDTVILLLVLVAIVGLVYRVIVSYYDAKEVDHTAHSGYRIHFEVDEMQLSVLHEIEGGDMVYIHEDGALLGYIAVTAPEEVQTNAASDTTAEDASQETSESIITYDKAMTARPVENGTDPDAVTVEGVILCTDWLFENGSLRMGESDRYLTRGSVVTVRTDRALMTIRITEIQPVE